MIDLDQVQARADAATEGPWMRCGTESSAVISASTDARFFNGIPGVEERIALLGYPRGNDDSWEVGVAAKDANAEFIAEARTDVPALVAEVRAAREIVEIARHADAPGLRAAIRAYDKAVG